MRSDLPSVSASASLAEAAALMERSGCQTLPGSPRNSRRAEPLPEARHRCL